MVEPRNGYERWLHKASLAERFGDKKEALRCLRKAREWTSDKDELFYLDLWIKRLANPTPEPAREE